MAVTGRLAGPDPEHTIGSFAVAGMRARVASNLHMTTRINRLIVGLIIALPVAVIIAWLATGLEVFTKHTKWVQESVRDPLFGDMITQSREVHGPLAGYYIGLDVVILSVLIAVIAATVLWWVNRRQAAKQGADHERAANEP
jgi:hypothetical protein